MSINSFMSNGYTLFFYLLIVSSLDVATSSNTTVPEHGFRTNFTHITPTSTSEPTSFQAEASDTKTVDPTTTGIPTQGRLTTAATDNVPTITPTGKSGSTSSLTTTTTTTSETTSTSVASTTTSSTSSPSPSPTPTPLPSSSHSPPTNHSTSTIPTSTSTSTFSNTTTTPPCLPCNGGSYAPKNDSGKCSVCCSGFCPPDSCSPCEAGTYTPNNNQGYSVCSQCQPGYFNNKKGQSKCILCDPGTYADQRGSTKCTLCPAGYYCPVAGQAPMPCPSNSVCPAGSIAAATCTKVIQTANTKTQTCDRTFWFYIFVIILSIASFALLVFLGSIVVMKVRRSKWDALPGSQSGSRLPTKELESFDHTVILDHPPSNPPVYQGF